MADRGGPNMDSVTLRQTHFKLGDDKNPYQTSLMAQSEGIENAGKCNPSLAEMIYVTAILYLETMTQILIRHFVLNIMIKVVYYLKIMLILKILKESYDPKIMN